MSWSFQIFGLEFKAQFYSRDNAKNILKGRGAAWVKENSRQVWADELEVDLKLNRVFARGNVRIEDGKVIIFCDSGTYALDGKEGVLDNPTVLFGQTVISGTTLTQLNQDQFELQEGIYTNCNTLPLIDREVGKCPFDVKVYGSKFFVTLDSYVHIYDGMVYAKELPIFYTPYFLAPAKTTRQSGVLTPSINFRQRLGNGFSLPVFLALGRWHDLTVTPTWWNLAGYHFEIDYRYIYSPLNMGRAKLFLLERPFNADASIAWIRPSERRYAGLFSEVGFDLHNQISLGTRSQSRQDLDWVSNNYWNQDFPNDFGGLGDFQYLRNQLSLTFPSDSYLTTATTKYNQSLINTLQTGADQGPAAQLPEIRFHRKTLDFVNRYFYFEWDNRLTHFFRPHSPFDNTADPSSPQNPDPDPQYDSNDFVRTGQRLILERKLIANAALTKGFQLQPNLRAGLFAYHFDTPRSQFKSQTQIDAEIPFALYLSKSFPGRSSDESIRHIVQPRVLYGASLFRSKTPDHPFFYKNPFPDFTSPRFDSLDDQKTYEFFRFEFINRLMRSSSSGSNRFLLAQVSNNYFLKPSSENNNEAGVGPLESYLDLQVGQFSAQIQGTYQLKAVQGIHEQDWSGTLAFSSPSGDKVSIATLLRRKINVSNNDETVVLSVYKTLPIYLDVFGSIEHSFRQSITRNYEVGFLFAAKPRNCWSLSFLSGRTVQREHYARMVFGLSFGGI